MKEIIKQIIKEFCIFVTVGTITLLLAKVAINFLGGIPSFYVLAWVFVAGAFTVLINKDFIEK